MPALMVTAGKDPVLLPVMSRGMEDLVRKSAARETQESSQVVLNESNSHSLSIADSKPEQRAHRGVRTLDSDGQARGS